MLPIIRLATKYNLGSRATTRFRRRYVSGPTKDGVNDLAQHETVTECSPTATLWMNLREQDRVIDNLIHKVVNARAQGTYIQVDYIFDEFTKIFGHPPESWKLLDLGDSLDQGVSGRRIFNATKVLLAKHGMAVKGLRFAIQGFGNVGSWIARLVHEEGGKVVAVSDLTSALMNKEGIDITALLKHMDSKENNLTDFSGVDSMDAVELLRSECDVLIPGVLGRALTRKTAADVKAKLVIETADFINHIDSDEVLSKKGVVILPDIFDNLRGEGLDYLEWLKAQGFMWGKEAKEIGSS